MLDVKQSQNEGRTREEEPTQGEQASLQTSTQQLQQHLQDPVHPQNNVVGESSRGSAAAVKGSQPVLDSMLSSWRRPHDSTANAATTPSNDVDQWRNIGWLKNGGARIPDSGMDHHTMNSASLLGNNNIPSSSQQQPGSAQPQSGPPLRLVEFLGRNSTNNDQLANNSYKLSDHAAGLTHPSVHHSQQQILLPRLPNQNS